MPCAVILTALKVEFLAVREYLVELDSPYEMPQGTVYEQGKFIADGQSWEIKLAEVGQGNSASAIETERAIPVFLPDVILFIGVAGGIKDVAIGDVVAATEVHSYESAKIEAQISTRPKSRQASESLIGWSRSVRRNTHWQQRIISRDTSADVAPSADTVALDVPTAFVAPIVSGEKIVASTASDLFQQLRQTYNDAIALETEGYGFLKSTSAYPTIQAMVIRGISDLIDYKNDNTLISEADRQRQAANHASAFAFELLAQSTPVEDTALAGLSRIDAKNAAHIAHSLRASLLDAFLASPSASINTEIDAASEELDAAEKALLDIYIDWLIEQNYQLELPGLPNSRHYPVELENVYVALRGDRSNPYERAQGQAIMEERAKSLENFLANKELTPAQEMRVHHRMNSLAARSPLPISVEERDRSHLFRKKNDKTVTLGEAFQQEYRLVILGDPGSGKTTLCRWLLLQLAKAYKNGKETVEVPLHHVDPSVEETAEQFNLGPRRIPIFVRVASFASAREEDADLPLAKFLGEHINFGSGDTITDSRGRAFSKKALNQVFLKLIKAGRAVVLLDGLDEIGNAKTRHEIVNKVDSFIRAFSPEERDYIDEDKGNQIVITSRIVGYQMAPLSNQSTHLTIEPMGTSAVNRFCEVWVEAALKVSLSRDQWNAETEAAAAQEATELKSAIANLKESGAEELASNPLLITILALVFKSGRGEQSTTSFPKQRVTLYETAVDILIEKWQERASRRGEREFKKKEVLKALIPIAAHIHSTSNIGAIDDPELEQQLTKYLPFADVSQFQQIIREDVGLLAARGHKVYGFLHLTFQEYLAGCWLIEETDQLGKRLLDKLSSPRWREPILMALGQLSVNLSEAQLENLLLSMLDRPDALSHLLPRTVILLVSALSEMVIVSPNVVKELGNRLLELYANRSLRERFPSLKQQLERAFARLAQPRYLKETKRVIYQAFTPVQGSYGEKAFAAASLVHKAQCYDRRIATELTQMWAVDSIDWNWSVDGALRDIALHFPTLHRLGPRSLQRVLTQRPKLANRFLSHPKWVRLGIAIYGGLDTSFNDQIAEAKATVARLSYEQTVAQSMPAEKERLDAAHAEWSDKLKELKNHGHNFDIRWIHRDACVTRLILDALSQDQSPDSIIPQLYTLIQTDDSITHKVDICLALAALGEPIAPILEEHPELFERVMSHVMRLMQLLESAVQSASSDAITLLKKHPQMPSSKRWLDLIRATLSIRFEFNQGSTDVIVLEDLAHPEDKHLLIAESLHLQFSGSRDDPIYTAAVMLDVSSHQLCDPPLKLANALANAHSSVGNQWDSPIVWPIVSNQARLTDPVGLMSAALDALTTIPRPFDFFRNWCLVQLAPLLKESGLLVEAIIIALGSVSDQFNTHQETLAALVDAQGALDDLFFDPDHQSILLKAVQAIEDPYLQFRGYLQLNRVFPYFQLPLTLIDSPQLHTLVTSASQGLGITMPTIIEDPELIQAIQSQITKQFKRYYSLMLFAQESATRITDPVLKEWALEQFVRLSHKKRRLPHLQRAIQAANAIPDSENRARALTRLARFSSLSQGITLFSSALDLIPNIQNDRHKVETLKLLRKDLDRYPQLYSQFQKIVANLSDWDQHYVMGLYAPLFQSYEQELDITENQNIAAVPSNPASSAAPAAPTNPLPNPTQKTSSSSAEKNVTHKETTSLVLGAILSDIRRQFSLSQDLPKIWPSLLSNQKEASCAALCQRAKSEPLLLTQEAAAVMNILIESGDIEIIGKLLPIVRNPDARSIPLLEDWLSTIDASLVSYVHLLLAEAGSFSQQIVETLTTLLVSGNDLVRYRTALALHSTKDDSMDFLYTSDLGEETLLTLAQSYLDLEQASPIAVVITWTFERIVHNDAQVMSKLIQMADSTAEKSEKAISVLKRINRIRDRAWHPFIEGLTAGEEQTQQALLYSLCTLLARNNLDDDKWIEAFYVLERLNQDILRDYEFVLDAPSKLVIAAKTAVKEASGPLSFEQIVRAETLFLEEKQNISDLLQEEDLPNIKTLFAKVGKIHLSGPAFLQRVNTAADKVEEWPQLLPLLVKWLEERLYSGSQDTEIERFMTDDLLNVTAACAERLPNTFYKAVSDQAGFQASLLEAIQYLSTFPGRQAALVLLSFLHQVTADTLNAVRAALRDCIEVQHVAIQTIDRYRDIDDDEGLLLQLFEDLLDDSPAVGFATAQVLSAIARNLYLSPNLRERIIEAMVKAIDDERSQRSVYLFSKREVTYQNYVYEIKYKGQLDEILYGMVTRLSGVTDFRDR